MIPSYKLMKLITVECITWLRSVEGCDEPGWYGDIAFEDMYCNVIQDICDGALDIPLYHEERKKFIPKDTKNNFNRVMLDTMLNIADRNRKNYSTYSDDFYIIDKELDILLEGDTKDEES